MFLKKYMRYNNLLLFFRICIFEKSFHSTFLTWLIVCLGSESRLKFIFTEYQRHDSFSFQRQSCSEKSDTILIIRVSLYLTSLTFYCTMLCCENLSFIVVVANQPFKSVNSDTAVMSIFFRKKNYFLSISSMSFFGTLLFDWTLGLNF